MSLPKSVLFAAAALALFFLATPTRLAAYDGTIPSFIVPTQNYAAIDVSGGTTTNAVELMVMEDSTNVAFSYWNGSAHMVGLWRQGALVAGSPQETGSQISLNLYSGAVVTGGQPYSAGILSSSAGEVFDQITGGASLPPGALPILPVFALNTSGELAASALFSDYSTTHYLTTFWPYGTKIANSIDAVGYLSLEPSFLGLNLLNGLLPNGTLLGAGEYAGLYFNGSADGFTYTGSGVGMMTEYNTAPFSTLGCDPVDIPNCSEVEGYGITAVALAGTTGVTRYDTKTNNQNGQVTSTLKALYLGSQVLDQDTSYPPSLGDIAAVNDQSDVVVTGTYEATSGLTAGAYYKTLAGGKQYFLANGSSLGLIESLANTEIRNVYPFMMSNRLMPTGTAVQPVLYIVFNAEIRVDAATQTWSPPTNLLLTLLSDGTTTLQQINAASTSPNLRLLSINSSGVIAAIGNAGTGDGHALLLLPVQVTNKTDPTIRNGANGNDMPIQFLQSSTDTNIGAVAWIAGNDPNNSNAPRMPNLQAQIGDANGLPGTNVYWKLQVIFHDRFNNPHRDFDTGSVQNTAVPEDTVTIPIAASLSQNFQSSWHKVTDGTPWNIYDDPDWKEEVNDFGFFGGDATLSVIITSNDGSMTLVPQTNYQFRIAGENPTAGSCETYINSQYGGPTPNWQNVTSAGTNTAPTVPGYWFAYAIAKEETDGDGGRTYYSNFLDNGGALTNKAKPWPGHEGRPDWNNDGSSANGSGGYGLFQLTFAASDPNFIMPRDWIWNWQTNVQQFLPIISQDISYTQSYLNYIKSHNSSYVDPSRLKTTADTTTFNFWESSVITLNNGASIFPLKNVGYNLGAWRFTPPWTYVPNGENYLYNVARKGVENHP
jgi:hypothetical protein